jgi:predicted acetyltransferase
MTAPQGYTRVDLPLDRSDEVIEVDSWGFAFTPAKDEREALTGLFNFDRARGIEVADASRGTVGTLAGVHTSFPYDLRVPGGGTVRTSGLTWVAVHQGHRRRGILKAMIDDHFTRSLARGEVVSALYASETEIYQRFGYGLAAHGLKMELARGASLRKVAGAADLTIRLETAAADAHGDAVAAVQRRMTRPGTMVEMAPVNVRDLFTDLESERNGAEQRRVAIVQDEHGPAAYAFFARKNPWVDGHGGGTTAVRTWGSATAAATQRLMSVLADLDLMSKVAVPKITIDDPLMLSLVNVRASSAAVEDNLWVRILDVPAALEARTYAADCDVVVELTDTHVPANAGAWHIAVVNGVAQVSKASADAAVQVGMSMQDLSAAYLGGVTLASLALAGLVEVHEPAALTSLSKAMCGDQLPVSNISF